jgi:hypothetical protein
LKRFNLFSNCKFATFGAKNKLSAMIQNWEKREKEKTDKLILKLKKSKHEHKFRGGCGWMYGFLLHVLCTTVIKQTKFMK